MKKASFIASVLFLAVAMALIAFAQPAFSATSKAKPKTIITLKWAEAFPAAGFYYPQILWLTDQVERRTQGRVKVHVYWGGSLAGWPQSLPALQTGLADVAHVPVTYFPSQMPLGMLGEMVGLSTDLWVQQKAVVDLYNEDPYMRAEQEHLGLKPLFTHDSGLMHYGFREEGIKTFADMKGKIVRTYGGSLFDVEKRIGMKSVFMPYGQIYEALARRTIDGSGFTYIVSDGFKHWEVMKSVVEVGAGYSLGPAREMKLSVWKKLPPDIQHIFMKLQSDWVDHFAEALYAQTGLLRQKWENYGVAIHKMIPKDKERLDKVILPAAQKEFLKQVEKMPGGEHAQEVWDRYQRIRDKYQKIVDTEGYPWAPKKK